MTIEIHTPELEQRVKRGIQSGQFHDVDDLLTQALIALEKDHPAIRKPQKTRQEAVAHIMEARKGRCLPDGVTIRELINKGRD
jgi:Arc/MetJ-type ribon-helix-helix transcriptional regulator